VSMNHPRRIGQLIRSVVPLTDHDIEEILQEQTLSHRPFGQIAVAWGLCSPGQVWQAWARQPDHTIPHINLEKVGVDAQAVHLLSNEQARQLHAIPIRHFDSLVVVAVSELSTGEALQALFQNGNLQFAMVLADAAQIDSAVNQYFRN